MLAVIILIFALVSPAFAQNHIAGFIFITEPRQVRIGEISEEITIQAQDSSGNPVSAGETMGLEFSSTSATGEFLNSSGEPVSTVMNSNWKNRTFYYRDSSSGTHALKVKATGRDSGKSWEVNQSITVSGGGSAAESDSAAAPSPPPSVESNSSPSSSPTIPLPTIKVYAGEDMTAMAGAFIGFRGAAFGFNGEPLENARFWWNFGDGGTQEGRVVTHIYRFPGKYTVGLHVSSGSYAASDYLTIEAIPNQLAISDVLQGEGGFVRLKNNASVEIDVSSWSIEDATGNKFFIPPRTRIGPKAEIALSNGVTGLLLDARFLPVRVRYPNGVEALVYSGAASIAVSLPSSEVMPLDSEVTPPKKLMSEPALDSAVTVAPEAVLEKNSSEPEGRQLAQTSAAGPGAYFFLVLAATLSLGASLGFVLVRRYAKT